MSLINQALAHAYGEDKAREILENNLSCGTDDWMIEPYNKEIKTVVTNTSHRYLEDDKK